MDDAREAKQDEKLETNADARRRQDKEDDAVLLIALDKVAPNKEPALYTRVRKNVSISDARADKAFERLITAQIVDRCDIETKIKSAIRLDKERGIRRHVDREQEQIF